DRRGVDRDNRRDKLAAVAAKHDSLADVRAELELVFEELRRQRGAVGELADIFCAIDDDKMAASVDQSGIAGLEPAVGGQRLLRRLRVLVVASEDAAGADEDLAGLVDPQIDAAKGASNG